MNPALTPHHAHPRPVPACFTSAATLLITALVALHPPNAAAREPAAAPGGAGVVDLASSAAHGSSWRPGLAPTLAPVSERSVAVAFVAELLLPSAGLFYTESYWEAGLELALVAGGLALFFDNFRFCIFSCEGPPPGNYSLAMVGFTMAVGGRLFGLIAAPVNAGAYNRRLEERCAESDADLPPRPHDEAASAEGRFIVPRPQTVMLSTPAIPF